MYSPFSNGVIRQQDQNDRRLAQQRIAEALAKESQRTKILVTGALNQIENDDTATSNVDLVWNRIQGDRGLRHIQLFADLNTRDYPCFEGWLNGARRRIETAEKKRLRRADERRRHQYRYANTVSFRPAYV